MSIRVLAIDVYGARQSPMLWYIGCHVTANDPNAVLDATT